MSIVTDCSMALSWYLPDEAGTASAPVLDSVVEAGGAVPVVFKIEFANALTVAVRRGRIGLDFRTKAFVEFSRLDMEQDLGGLENCWSDTIELADRHRLSAYDASYLELAIRRRFPLATLDTRLADAARKEGVAIMGPLS